MLVCLALVVEVLDALTVAMWMHGFPTHAHAHAHDTVPHSDRSKTSNYDWRQFDEGFDQCAHVSYGDEDMQ